MSFFGLKFKGDPPKSLKEQEKLFRASYEKIRARAHMWLMLGTVSGLLSVIVYLSQNWFSNAGFHQVVPWTLFVAQTLFGISGVTSLYGAGALCYLRLKDGYYEPHPPERPHGGLRFFLFAMIIACIFMYIRRISGDNNPGLILSSSTRECLIISATAIGAAVMSIFLWLDHTLELRQRFKKWRHKR